MNIRRGERGTRDRRGNRNGRDVSEVVEFRLELLEQMNAIEIGNARVKQELHGHVRYGLIVDAHDHERVLGVVQ